MDKFLLLGVNRPKIGRMIFVKSWYESKAIWGAIVVIISVIANLFQISIDTDTQANIVELVMTIIGGVGGLIAIWGRIKATKQIK